MARPPKVKAPDLSVSHELTAGLIERLTCPMGKQQVFMRDSKAPGLRVRVTTAGAKSFVFEAKLNRQTIRRTIGDVRAWTIEAARIEANRLRVTLDGGTDPRELERQQQATKATEQAAAAVRALTVGEVWKTYTTARKPYWGERHYADHLKLSDAGGQPFKRGKGITQPGPLFTFMALPLRDLTAPVIEAWAAKEGKTRPTSARLAWRCLKAFLAWCSEQQEYAPVMASVNPAKTKKSRESLGRVNKKKDVLQREQLKTWFDAVKKIGNPCISAYLQVMLLTGARPGEIVTMQWDNVNTQWKGLTIKDKVDRITRERTIPLTPYVAHLLSALPRRNGWVFSSPTSATGHITTPNDAHNIACDVAGISRVTLHGLRRSFKSASEWLEIQKGVRENIMGHVAKSTDEDYTVRPLDLLRVHHEKIEAWILEQAGIVFDAKAEPGKLHAVAR